jgi:hypothetical protein
MNWRDKIEIVAEKRGVIVLSLVAAVAWHFKGNGFIENITGKNDIIYQTLVMFATIVVALLATFKVIIVTVDRHEGISLLRSNKNMFNRFIDYIFWCICSNILFSAMAFYYLVVDEKISTSIGCCIFVYVAVFSVLSLLRVLVLFKIIIRRAG